ncbi:hypothetical protein MIMGU_mgv11b020508mg, partial [Erythranthe guttata]
KKTEKVKKKNHSPQTGDGAPRIDGGYGDNSPPHIDGTWKMNNESIDGSLASNNNIESIGFILRPNLDDVGWKYGHLVDGGNSDKTKCNFCGKIGRGGIRIGKLSKFKSVIEKAKTLTIFLYANHSLLALMRYFTKKRDLVRPGVTMFATSFLDFQSLMEKKDNLRTMFNNSKWEKCKHSKTVKGKAVYAIVSDLSWWNGVIQCLKAFTPLVRVLRLVDGDRKPSMDFLYGELEKAKKEIKEVFNNNESSSKPILNIVERKQDSNIQLQGSIMDELFDCIERFYPKHFATHQTILNKELPMYKKK